MGHFSASRSALLAACGYPFRPDVEWPYIESSPEAKIGTVAWARGVAHGEGRVDPGNVGLTPEEAKDCDDYTGNIKRWIDEHKRLGWRYEVKFAWSPSRDVGRELPESAGLRDYYHAPDCADGCTRHCEGDERPGSTDLVTFDGELLEITDAKTGVTPLSQYIPQIRTLGMFGQRAHGVKRVRLRLVKFYKDKPPEEWTEELRRLELDAVAMLLRERLARAADAQPTPGNHCNDLWCPARVVCPAVTSAVPELIPAADLVRLPRFSREFISHEHDAEQLALVRVVNSAADELKKIIKARTPAEGVILEDGRIFKEWFHSEARWSQESLLAKVRDLAKRAGLAEEDIERELEMCRYRFDKSEGLKAVKKKAKAA